MGREMREKAVWTLPVCLHDTLLTVVGMHMLLALDGELMDDFDKLFDEAVAPTDEQQRGESDRNDGSELSALNSLFAMDLQEVEQGTRDIDLAPKQKRKGKGKAKKGR